MLQAPPRLRRMDVKLSAREALRLHRTRAKLSQIELQMQLGIGRGNLLSLIESGIVSPPPDLIQKFETMFGIPAALWLETPDADSEDRESSTV